LRFGDRNGNKSLLRLPQSTTRRKLRQISLASSPPSVPVLRAALASDIPARTGAPAPSVAKVPAVIARPTQDNPRINVSASCPIASLPPSRAASRISPNTNRSPSVVPATPAASFGSPVTKSHGEALRRVAGAGVFGHCHFYLFCQFGRQRIFALGGQFNETVGKIGILLD
jgi:hypothetical protein